MKIDTAILTLHFGLLLSTCTFIQAITPQEETKIMRDIVAAKEKVDVQKFIRAILSAHGALFTRNLLLDLSKGEDEQRWVATLKEINKYVNENAPTLLGVYEMLAEMSTVIINISKTIFNTAVLPAMVPEVIAQEKETGIKAPPEKKFNIARINMSFIKEQLKRLTSYNYQAELDKIKNDLANIINYKPSLLEKIKPRFGEKEKNAARILFYLAVFINKTLEAMFKNLNQLEELKKRISTRSS